MDSIGQVNRAKNFAHFRGTIIIRFLKDQYFRMVINRKSFLSKLVIDLELARWQDRSGTQRLTQNPVRL